MSGLKTKSEPTIIPLATLLAEYQDGDEHGWDVEFEFLWTHHAVKMASLMKNIKQHGFKYPIELGNDGRVWNGHHRLAIAHRLGITHVPVVYAGHTPS